MRNENELLVRTPNPLLSGRKPFDLQETRLFYALLGEVREDDPENKRYCVPFKSILPPGAGGSQYKLAREAIANIKGKSIEFSVSPYTGHKGKGWLQVITYAFADERDDKIELQIHPLMIQYFVDMKRSGYTIVKLHHLMALPSSYSVRIYELLEQYRNTAAQARTFTITELRKELGLENKLLKYGSIKQRVILPAQKHLAEHTDIAFEFEEVLYGKSVFSITFKIIPQTHIGKDASQLEMPLPMPEDPDASARAYMINLHGQKDAEAFITVRGMEFIKESIRLLEDGGPHKNPKAYHRTMLLEDPKNIANALAKKTTEKKKKKASTVYKPEIHKIPEQYSPPEDIEPTDEQIAETLARSTGRGRKAKT